MTGPACVGWQTLPSFGTQQPMDSEARDRQQLDAEAAKKEDTVKEDRQDFTKC